MQRYGFFSYHPNVFKRKWEKSDGFPLIWQNWRERCRVHIIFIYAREGKFSMIPVWVFLRFESAGLSLLLSKWFGWWFLDKKPGYTPDMFARLRLVWRRQASAYERKLSTRKPDTDRRWWLCVTTSQTYRAINRKYNDRKGEQVWWHQPPPSLPRRGGTVTIAIDNLLIIRQLQTAIM